MTGACHAPVDGRQGKALTDKGFSTFPVSIEKSADLEMDGQRGFEKFSLAVDGSIEANRIAEGLPVTPYFEDVGTTRKPKKRQRLPQKPHTPSESPRHFAAAG